MPEGGEMPLRESRRSTPYGKPNWTTEVPRRGKCEIEGCTIRFTKKMPGHRDHLIPRRRCVEMGVDPEDSRNFVNACASHHAQKKSAENILFGKGGYLGFFTELNRIGWPAERAKQMLRDYGCRFVGE